MKFSVVCSLFNWTQKAKSTAKKRSKLRKFLDTFDYFGAVRLILPAQDRHRGSYGLRESVLAACLADALGPRHVSPLRRCPPPLQLAEGWTPNRTQCRELRPRCRRGGNIKAVLQNMQGSTSGGLIIKGLNRLLDRLASSENRTEKISVLSDLIKETSAQEMKWIIKIILKVHVQRDPEVYNLKMLNANSKGPNHIIIMDHALLPNNLCLSFSDIEVGKPVRPQLAMRVCNANTAWKKLHGKEVAVECKFDGDRIQIHNNGQEIHFFSRNFLDHPEYEHSVSDVIMQNVLVDRCILDGEMLVWDATMNRFAEFGSNQEIGEPCWSVTAYNVDDVERFYKEAVENRDEGIVLKDRVSKWEPGDQSGKWLKLKRGYYGSGRRGGEVAQFLVGLAERSSPNTFPSRFISFCRVGTGLSDEELDVVVTKLKPFFWYYLDKGVVYVVFPLISCIQKAMETKKTALYIKVFAAPYSLRYPRVDRVRYDKPWHECLDVQSFVELVDSSNGTTKRGADCGEVQNNKPRGMKLSRKGEKKRVSVVSRHFIQTDVSYVTEATLIFSDTVFSILNHVDLNSS
ncbi:hypothetical protein RHMOL_Rhmol01G0116900 [Rhododendron molle]|uniref:Uncharacterized protein n=1 Tax=Rhododendron molle TaxID=49168 RepID=A0ACC0Q052_RHOML|nr:hypothetical protein RHMOL_Rhmol01G0116900 [Rhododendron molle]